MSTKVRNVTLVKKNDQCSRDPVGGRRTVLSPLPARTGLKRGLAQNPNKEEDEEVQIRKLKVVLTPVKKGDSKEQRFSLKPRVGEGVGSGGAGGARGGVGGGGSGGGGGATGGAGGNNEEPPVPARQSVRLTQKLVDKYYQVEEEPSKTRAKPVLLLGNSYSEGPKRSPLSRSISLQPALSRDPSQPTQSCGSRKPVLLTPVLPTEPVTHDAERKVTRPKKIPALLPLNSMNKNTVEQRVDQSCPPQSPEKGSADPSSSLLKSLNPSPGPEQSADKEIKLKKSPQPKIKLEERSRPDLRLEERSKTSITLQDLAHPVGQPGELSKTKVCLKERVRQPDLPVLLTPKLEAADPAFSEDIAEPDPTSVEEAGAPRIPRLHNYLIEPPPPGFQGRKQRFIQFSDYQPPQSPTLVQPPPVRTLAQYLPSKPVPNLDEQTVACPFCDSRVPPDFLTRHYCIKNKMSEARENASFSIELPGEPVTQALPSGTFNTVKSEPVDEQQDVFCDPLRILEGLKEEEDEGRLDDDLEELETHSADSGDTGLYSPGSEDQEEEEEEMQPSNSQLSGGAPLPCRICNRTVPRQHIYSHYKQFHQMYKVSDNDYGCPYCPSRNFAVGFHVERHIDSVHRKVKEKCLLCGVRFQNLRSHQEKYHTMKNMGKCKLCGKVVKYLNSHHCPLDTGVQKNKMVNCPRCGNIVKEKYLRIHQRSHCVGSRTSTFSNFRTEGKMLSGEGGHMDYQSQRTTEKKEVILKSR